MSQPTALPKLAYSVAEFCELVGLGRTGAFKEIRDRRLRIVKVGRRTLIPAGEVMAWLERLPRAADETSSGTSRVSHQQPFDALASSKARR